MFTFLKQSRTKKSCNRAAYNAFSLYNFTEFYVVTIHLIPDMQRAILAIDDSPTIRKFLTLALSSKGFRVVSAVDGMQALEIIGKDTFDLIITDLNMPNVDGFELIQTLRSEVPYKDIPIIVLSSISSQEDIDRSISLGASSYILKPFNNTTVVHEVLRYFT